MNAPLSADGIVVPAPGRKAGGVSPWRRRLDVTARTVAGAVMGYVVAALSAAVLSRLLPGPKDERIMAAMLLSFAVYAAVALWAFADRLAWRVWAGLIGLSAALGAILWLSLKLEPIL